MSRQKRGKRKSAPIKPVEQGMLTVVQVSQRLGYCGAVVRKFIASGQLIASKPGNRFLISEENYQKFLIQSQSHQQSESAVAS